MTGVEHTVYGACPVIFGIICIGLSVVIYVVDYFVVDGVLLLVIMSVCGNLGNIVGNLDIHVVLDNLTGITICIILVTVNAYLVEY